MKRLFLLVILIAPLSAMAQDLQARCTAMSEIVGAAVLERQSGNSLRNAIHSIRANLRGDLAASKDDVPSLVDWVYGIPDRDFGSNVKADYLQACLNR